MTTQNLRVSLWLPTTIPLANEGVVVEDDGEGTEFAPINIPGPAGPAGPAGPQGSPGVGSIGPPGAPNQLIAGPVTTGAPGTSADVTITGTPPAQTISFVIPRGNQGLPGPVGPQGPPGSDGGVTDHGALTGLSDDDHPQYLTQARGDALYAPIGSGVSDGDKGDITVSGSGATFTIDPQAVTFAKIQNITTARLLGRATAGAGVLEEITLGTNLSFSGTTLNAAGGGAIPGGSTTQLQYNNAGAFGGARLTYNPNYAGAGIPAFTFGDSTNGTAAIFGPSAASTTSAGGTLVVKGAPGGATSGNGGAVQFNAGDATSGTGGGTTISGGSGPNGGNVTINGGVPSGGTAGIVEIWTNGSPRLSIAGSGAWTVGGGVGTSGQVLTSAGAGASPTWAAVPGGGGGSPGGATSNIQFNNAGAFGGEADFTWDSSSNVLGVGSSAVPGVIRGGDSTAGGLTIRAGNATTGSSAALTLQGGSNSVAAAAGGNVAITAGSPGANGVPGSINLTIPVAGSAAAGTINLTSGRANATGGAINITGGTSSNPAGTGGAVNITGGLTSGSSTGGAVVIKGGGYDSNFGVQSGSTGGTVTVAGGDMVALGNGTGGNVVVRGGQVTGGYTGASGSVTVQGGDGLSTNAGGNLTLRGGTSASGTAGYLTHLTAGVERFRILANGAWSVGSAGTDTGTTGQVLTSNGSGSAPTWQTPASDARLKENIADLDLGLAFVRQLRPVSFAWIHDETKMPHFGLIAQDVLAVLAGRECGMVDTSGERYGMTYTELIPILIRAIQELAQFLSQQEAA